MAGERIELRRFRTDVPFPGVAGAPNMLNKSYTITAEVEIPEGGAEGMLVTDGGRFAGYGFYLKKGVPVFTWNLIQAELVKWQGKEALAPGKHTLEFDWKYDGPGLGKGGTGTLKVDGEVLDTKPMPKSLPVGIGWVETFNVGVDTGTPILNPGESAILALGAIRDMPWVVDGEIKIRKICQLALSFDHRVVDGQQGSQFLADVGALLADPGFAMTY